MAKKNTSKQDKANFLDYKTTNRVEKNKIKKLTRHCTNFPKDQQAIDRLLKLEREGGYRGRTKPLAPGSNKPEGKLIKLGSDKIETWVFPKNRQISTVITPSKTAKEQLSKLLGIPLVLTTLKKKPKIRVKNVRTKKILNRV